MDSSLAWAIPTGLAIAISIILYLPQGTPSSVSPSSDTSRTTVGATETPQSSTSASLSLSSSSTATTDDYTEYDMDKWKSRRNSARFICDACVILTLFISLLLILSRDYEWDAITPLTQSFPREMNLLKDIWNGIRGLRP